MKQIEIKDMSPIKNVNLYCLIYELKGIVGSLSDLSDFDEGFYNPIIDKVSTKTSEIISVIEKDVLLEGSRTQLDSISRGIG